MNFQMNFKFPFMYELSNEMNFPIRFFREGFIWRIGSFGTEKPASDQVTPAQMLYDHNFWKSLIGGAGVLRILARAAAAAAAAGRPGFGCGALWGDADQPARPAGHALQDVRQGLLQHLSARPVRAVHARPLNTVSTG